MQISDSGTIRGNLQRSPRSLSSNTDSVSPATSLMYRVLCEGWVYMVGKLCPVGSPGCTWYPAAGIMGAGVGCCIVTKIKESRKPEDLEVCQWFHLFFKRWQEVENIELPHWFRLWNKAELVLNQGSDIYCHTIWGKWPDSGTDLLVTWGK